MTPSNGNIFRVTDHFVGNSPVIGDFSHKGQWHRAALMFSVICVYIDGRVNNREAGNLRRHRAHYDVIVMNETPTKRKSHNMWTKFDRGYEIRTCSTFVVQYCNLWDIQSQVVPLLAYDGVIGMPKTHDSYLFICLIKIAYILIDYFLWYGQSIK